MCRCSPNRLATTMRSTSSRTTLPNRSAWEDGHIGSVFVDHDDLKIARLNITERNGHLSLLHFAYLVATRGEIAHFTEDHELALFTEEEYRSALESAGLSVEHDPEGLMGRGLCIGTASELIS
jgi:hypothetical protein